MDQVCFLLDEHVDPRLRRQLLQREPDMSVWRICDPLAPPRGTLDPDILEWCAESGFLLVTNNRASMPRHVADHLAKDRVFPGIFVIGPLMSLGEILEELLLIWQASTPDEYQNQIRYLPLT